MKITYKPNPLDTVIELEPHEVEILKLKLEIDELQNAICAGWMHLNDKDEKWYDPKKARDELDHEYWYSDKFKARIQELADHYVEELKSTHCGDCTCVPMSCSKCHAEYIIGSDTLKVNGVYVGKHSLYKIDAAFNKNTRTIDEAIESLENPDYSWDKVPADSGWRKYEDGQQAYEKHIPRWKEECKHALNWLKSYRDTHFKGE